MQHKGHNETQILEKRKAKHTPFVSAEICHLILQPDRIWSLQPGCIQFAVVRFDETKAGCPPPDTDKECVMITFYK